jgi:hypothetical protein
MKFKEMLLFLLVVLISGCKTTYQPRGSTGGYEDKKLGEGVYYIYSRVNASTEPKKALEFWHRRAKELCGSDYVAEIESKDTINVNPGPYNRTSVWPVVDGIAKCKLTRE